MVFVCLGEEGRVEGWGVFGAGRKCKFKKVLYFLKEAEWGKGNKYARHAVARGALIISMDDCYLVTGMSSSLLIYYPWHPSKQGPAVRHRICLLLIKMLG